MMQGQTKIERIVGDATLSGKQVQTGTNVFNPVEH